MTQHLHSTFVPGCYRCDLNLDELPIDDEPWDDSEAVEATCNSCGGTRLCLYVPDPYIAELSPEDNPESEWWCGSCYSHRHDEV